MRPRSMVWTPLLCNSSSGLLVVGPQRLRLLGVRVGKLAKPSELAQGATAGPAAPAAREPAPQYGTLDLF